MKQTLPILFLALAAILVLLVAPFVGIERITPADVFSFSSSDARDALKEMVFWRLRAPRVLTGFFAGGALALGGMAFQALFRNPLATPFTLGVSSGAAFGAAFVVGMGWSGALLWLPVQTLGAWCGALLSFGLVYGLTRRARGFSSATMLLAGVAVSFLFSSLILVVQYAADVSDTFRIIRWLMGGLETVGYRSFANVAPVAAVGSAVVLLLVQELNLLTCGEDLAASRGVAVVRVKQLLMAAVSIMVAGVVAWTGPIGFVGMMSPHICRRFVGADHTVLAPVTFLFGGTFLVVCDCLARTVIAPAELPVGIITALLGGPFFLWLLMRGATLRGGEGF